jgi:hypothetical protein
MSRHLQKFDVGVARVVVNLVLRSEVIEPQSPDFLGALSQLGLTRLKLWINLKARVGRLLFI